MVEPVDLNKATQPGPFSPSTASVYALFSLLRAHRRPRLACVMFLGPNPNQINLKVNLQNTQLLLIRAKYQTARRCEIKVLLTAPQEWQKDD